MVRFSGAAVVLLSTAALFWAGTAGAFSISTVGGGKVTRWKIDDVGYYLDANGWSGISNGKDKQKVIDSFNDWQAVSCSFLKFHKAGETTVNNVTSTGAGGNNKNEVIWKEGYWPYGSYVLGVAGPLISITGEFMEADIAFNGTIGWNTSGSTWGSMDVKSVAIHEIGHLFGLQHNLQYNENDPPTMAPTVDPYGKSATLHKDDKNGICFLYPASGTYSCSSNSECPFVVTDNTQGEEYYSKKYKCKSGECVPEDSGPVQPGQGELGASCKVEADCKSPTFCVETTEGNFCTQWCSVDAQDCPDGFGCFDVDGSDEGLCVSTSGIATFGEFCLTDDNCISPYFCLEWWSGPFCTKECADVDGGTGCPNGYTCFSSPSSPTGGGACYPGTATKEENAKTCTLSSECKSGMCFPTPGTSDKSCRDKCSPSSDNCPSGYKCVAMPGDMTGGKGGCIPLNILPEKMDGSLCEAGWQCASGYCYYDSEVGQSTCRQLCNPPSGNCPAGSECLDIGGGQGACLPAPDPQPDGSTCLHHHDCLTGYCVPLPGTDKKICRNACTPSSGCSAGYECILYDDPEVGACMPIGNAVGEICSSSVECTTQVCWAESGTPLCRRPCVEGQCPLGYSCFQPTTYGPVCVEESGSLPVGAVCIGDAQCISNVCFSGYCRKSCDVLALQCPQGYGCVPVNNSTEGACMVPGIRKEGSTCTSDVECETLLCVESNSGGRTCRQPCVPSSGQCPQGFQCEEPAELTGLGACLPEQTPEDKDPQHPEQPDDEKPEVKGGSGCETNWSPPGSNPLAALLLLALLALLIRGTFGRKRA